MAHLYADQNSKDVIAERLRQFLQQFCEKNGILYLVVVDLERSIRWESGNKDLLIHNGLINMFDDAERLNESVRHSPTGWSQGVETCLVTKVSKQCLAGIFYHRSKEFLEDIRWGEQISQELSRMLLDEIGL